ncbi:MAG: hypothetical protein MUP27_04190 [Desulfobacterales bacterium]|nr:hypothetical protein [Desulfobacterales bacterium]
MSDLTPEEKLRVYEEEKTRIEAEAKAKVAAQAKAKKKKTNKGCLIIILVIAALYAVYYFLPKDKTYRPAQSTYQTPRATIAGPTAEDEKMLKDLMESGIVESVNVNMNEATIDPASWARMKLDAKKHLGWFLATYCGKKKGTGLNWVDILDSYSGKKLAKYSESWGFKVY